MKYKLVLLILAFFSLHMVIGQNKMEREYRIKKSQFPKTSLDILKTELGKVKKLRFYKERDSNKISYEAKFKKDRLWYSVEFSETGDLEDIEITIKQVDLPNDSWQEVNSYLQENFTQFRIKKMQQQYLPLKKQPTSKTFKQAFQNLMLPDINYEIIVSGKTEKGFEDFEILFDAKGNFKTVRKSLPPNYDHILY
ncbi:hypothetical protein [Sediminicola arcticus]|jgi:hypothetical protein|uniref:Beta-lactamase-inhibitor-like PepSY-like domain-containing protein n=1 Tax=Sediminicola arcticus TaxID=1574308 RepID=A0ABV2SQ20_9FLAO